MTDVTIDGVKVSVERGATILDAARSAGISIPTLCHHDGLPSEGCCRICVVEAEEHGWSKLVASCMYPIKSEINILTRSERVIAARKFIIQLLLNRNPKAIIIGKLAEEYGVKREERFTFDSDLCVRCGRCVRACELNGTNAIGMARAGFNRAPSAPYGGEPLDCIGCASCAEVCPTGKITYKDSDGTRRIWERDFKLVPCERCGAPAGTGEQIAFIAGLGAGEGAEDSSRLCDRCRKAVYGGRFVK